MNELALIFGKLGIDTLEVLVAAGSKWNFLPLRPGPYDALILAVAHRDFIDMGAAGLRALGKGRWINYDVKVMLPTCLLEGRR